jgi:hypothetical protein
MTADNGDLTYDCRTSAVRGDIMHQHRNTTDISKPKMEKAAL